MHICIGGGPVFSAQPCWRLLTNMQCIAASGCCVLQVPAGRRFLYTVVGATHAVMV
jgi:hypothetical protein